MRQPSPEMRRCIDDCLSCYSSCLSTASYHCLELGERHTEPAHFRLLLSCAEICRTAAHFMLLGSHDHKYICEECADICQKCADDCERLGDMRECVEACRRCEKSCRQMAE
jgi:hypothetical protein